MSIAEDLKRRLRHWNLEKPYEASVICAQAKKVAKGGFEPISFKNSVLKVSATTAGKAHLVKIQQDRIVKEVNALLGKELIKKLFVIIGEQEPPR